MKKSIAFITLFLLFWGLFSACAPKTVKVTPEIKTPQANLQLNKQVAPPLAADIAPMAEDIKPEPRPYSIHDITWYEVLKMGGLLNKTRLFAVEIDTLNMKEELNPALQEKVGYYAEKLYEILGYT